MKPLNVARAISERPEAKLVAKTEHGTYTFDIVAVEQSHDGPTVLRLKEIERR